MINTFLRLICIAAVMIVIFVIVSKRRKVRDGNDASDRRQVVQRNEKNHKVGGAVSNSAKSFIEGKGHRADFAPQFKVCANCEYWCGSRETISRRGYVKVLDSIGKAKCANKNKSRKLPLNAVPAQGAACEYWEKWTALD